MKRPGMKIAFSTLLVAVTVSTVSGFAEEPPPTNARPALPYPKKIKPVTVCGDIDESQHVELYKGNLGVDTAFVQTNEPSTVQLQWLPQEEMEKKFPGYAFGNVPSVRWCSGTLISDTMVLTAGHCFDVQSDQNSWISPYNPKTTQFLKPSDLATLQVANFKYQINKATGKTRKEDRFPIVKLIEYREGGLDYAIIELSKNGNGDLPSKTYAAASVLTSAPAHKDVIAVIQHPEGDPKKIEAGHVKATSGPWVYYGDIDTHSGSSGSGVRNSAGAVIGVHTNGGCEAIGGANRGVLTSAISAVSKVF
jgi:V8-like Glu-specific endopeptidase